MVLISVTFVTGMQDSNGRLSRLMHWNLEYLFCLPELKYVSITSYGFSSSRAPFCHFDKLSGFH
uniref:Uncharacterized protein n=1 Tax=Rhizophora mucronata TaxID=61149 RepID=A0A2P2JEQ6_RHIMU